jgi:hypothetical protein
MEEELQRYATVYVPQRYRPKTSSSSSASEAAATASSSAATQIQPGGKQRPIVRVAGFWAERRRLLAALERCTLLALPHHSTAPPLVALLRHQWGLGPSAWDLSLVLAALRALAAQAVLEEVLTPCVDMLLDWATGFEGEGKQVPAAAATAAIPATEEEEAAAPTSLLLCPVDVRLAALAVLGRLVPVPLGSLEAEGRRLRRLLGAVVEAKEQEEKDSSTGGSHLALCIAAALALPVSALPGLTGRLQPLLAACLAASFHAPSIHRAALRLLLRLPPSATLPHTPTLLRGHLYNDEEEEEEPGDWEQGDEGATTISSRAARALNRLPIQALNAAIRAVMQHLVKGQPPALPPDDDTSQSLSQQQPQRRQRWRRRRKHPLEALALLDRTLVHARGEAFLFRRLLPPAGPQLQRQFCQVRF